MSPEGLHDTLEDCILVKLSWAGHRAIAWHRRSLRLQVNAKAQLQRTSEVGETASGANDDSALSAEPHHSLGTEAKDHSAGVTKPKRLR